MKERFPSIDFLNALQIMNPQEWKDHHENYTNRVSEVPMNNVLMNRVTIEPLGPLAPSWSRVATLLACTSQAESS